MHELRRYMETEQPRVNACLFKEIETLHGLIRPVAQHVFQGGGKRLRPLLLLLVARNLGRIGDDDHDLYAMACSLEFLHSATLLHDDILDGAELRRGTAAAHMVFGQTQTILAGDALLALGNSLMARPGDPRLTACISEAIMRTAVGEIAEIAHIRDGGLSEAQYLEIITGKTAFLIQAACQCGAIAAQADPAQVQAAASFGLNLGIAFQLVDDALDYAATQEQVGKPVGSDLREGKLTLPLLYYLQKAAPERRGWFLERLAMSAFTDTDLQNLVQEIREMGCDSRTRELAGRYARQAADALASFPDTQEKQLLEQVLEYVINRDK